MNNNESQQGPNELEQAAANEESSASSVVQSEEHENTVPAVNAIASGQEAPKSGKGGSSVVWMALSAVLAILLIIVLIKPPFGSSSEVVASVNGSPITKDKLYEELVAQGGKATMENMISEELITQAAKKAGVSVTDEEVQKEIQTIIDSVGSEEQFDALLSQYSMTREMLKDGKYYDILIRKILEPQTNVTDEDVKAYFDENKDTLGSPAQVRASHILVATKEEADSIYEQLQNGADFAELVQQHSLDTGSVATDGDLDFFQATEMETNFSNAAFSMKVGEISQPVESSYGYGFHIIKKTDEKAAVTPTLEDKAEEIRLLLVTEQVAGLSSDWLANIRKEAKITNTLDEPLDDTTASTVK